MVYCSMEIYRVVYLNLLKRSMIFPNQLINWHLEIRFVLINMISNTGVKALFCYLFIPILILYKVLRDGISPRFVSPQPDLTETFTYLCSVFDYLLRLLLHNSNMKNPRRLGRILPKSDYRERLGRDTQRIKALLMGW